MFDKDQWMWAVRQINDSLIISIWTYDISDSCVRPAGVGSQRGVLSSSHLLLHLSSRRLLLLQILTSLPHPVPVLRRGNAHPSTWKTPACYLFILVIHTLPPPPPPPPQTCDESSCLVSSWTSQQVCQWLRGLNMEQYVPEFSARDVDGQQLLQMDGNKLKVSSVHLHHHRSRDDQFVSLIIRKHLHVFSLTRSEFDV